MRRPFILFISTIVIVATGFGETDAGASTESFIGLCSQITRDTERYAPYKVHPQLLDRIKAANIDLTRTGFKWKTIHPSPNQWDWRIADAVVASARERDVNILALVTGIPRWAVASPADHIQQWLEFVDSLSSRYVDDIHTWELWNEPNGRSGKYWPQDALPDAFVQFTISASEKIRENQPDATILLGGLATGKKADPFGFWESTFKLGILHAVDGVAYHPYHYPGLKLLSFNNQLRKLISKYTTQEKQLWVTEFGVPAVAVSDAGKFSYDSQKKLLLRTILVHWATGGSKFYIYSLWDKAPVKPGITKQELRKKRNYYFGLLEKDMTPKNSYSAIAWLSSLLKEYDPTDFEEKSDGLLVTATNRKTRETVYFSWGASSQAELLGRADTLSITSLSVEEGDFAPGLISNRKLGDLRDELTLWK